MTDPKNHPEQDPAEGSRETIERDLQRQEDQAVRPNPAMERGRAALRVQKRPSRHQAAEFALRGIGRLTLSEINRSNKRMIRIGATAVIVAIAAVVGSYLIGPATDPRTTSVSAPAKRTIHQ